MKMIPAGNFSYNAYVTEHICLVIHVSNTQHVIRQVVCLDQRERRAKIQLLTSKMTQTNQIYKKVKVIAKFFLLRIILYGKNKHIFFSSILLTFRSLPISLIDLSFSFFFSHTVFEIRSLILVLNHSLMLALAQAAYVQDFYSPMICHT